MEEESPLRQRPRPRGSWVSTHKLLGAPTGAGRAANAFAPAPKGMWSRLLLSRKRESRPPSRAPGLAGCPLRRRRNNALLPQRRKGLAGAVRVGAAGQAEPSSQVVVPPFGPQRPLAGESSPVASLGPTCTATRRRAGRGLPLGSPGTSLCRRRTDQAGEDGSSKAFELEARAAKPPS